MLRHLGFALAVSTLLLAVGCAGSQAPWDVDPKDQRRFRKDEGVCRMLTDDKAGELRLDRFDTCMKRRGWKRQNFIQRLL
jgi:hypothetical protein